ncbi:MAG: hypothetical protein RIR11_5054 [Bacteroidota bacterium]|jgi:hypothetical protein
MKNIQTLKYLPALVGFLLFLLVANSCSPLQKVYAETEPGINLYQYHTYGWLDNPSTIKGAKGPAWLTESTNDSIRSSVEKQLDKLGFIKSSAYADLTLHYHIVLKNEMRYVYDLQCRSYEIGNYDSRCDRVTMVPMVEGTLIIDLLDTATGNQVWRGGAVSYLDHMQPNEVNDRLSTAIQEIFKEFPRAPKGKALPLP